MNTLIQTSNSIKRAIRNLVLSVLALTAVAITCEHHIAWAQNEEAGSIWGSITYYTNTHVVVDGKQYTFHPNVTIDTYSLKADKRGNVRLMLDSYGTVLQLFFYGIDMPEVIERFKK